MPLTGPAPCAVRPLPGTARNAARPPGPDIPARASAYSICRVGDVRGRGGHGPVQAEIGGACRGRAGHRPDGSRPAVAGAGQADAGPGHAVPGSGHAAGRRTAACHGATAGPAAEAGSMTWVRQVLAILAPPQPGFVKRCTCVVCGAPKKLPTVTAYVYCDYCASLIDYDLRRACEGDTAPEPAYAAT